MSVTNTEWVTSAGQRSGLLVAIISGGRPRLAERTTAQFIESLKAAGLTVVWVVSEKDAPGYERDDCEVVTYTQDWAFEYAKTHWMRVEPPECGGFMGAFVGREAACREAERRGCWGVMQLDDNIADLTFLRHSQASRRTSMDNGGMGLYADLLAAVVLSTNARTAGAQLSSVPTPERKVARPGFPYSLFVEQVGEGREEWYGPYEDDITHSFQYGDRADGVTAAIVPMIRYMKEHKSSTGMRAKYDHTRSVQLQRMMPQGAQIKVMATKSNGRGEPRVFHKMNAGAIRNPLVVQDRELFEAVRDRLGVLASEWMVREKELNKEKLLQRLERSQKK